MHLQSPYARGGTQCLTLGRDLTALGCNRPALHRPSIPGVIRRGSRDGGRLKPACQRPRLAPARRASAVLKPPQSARRRCDDQAGIRVKRMALPHCNRRSEVVAPGRYVA